MFLGVDEAGRGPVLGPLVIGGLVSSDQESLRELGVKDSKELSPDRREALYRELEGAYSHCIMSVPASTIDLCRSEMTLNELEVLCFSSVIISILTGRPFRHPSIPGDVEARLKGTGAGADRIIMDAADVNEERFGNRVSAEISRFAMTKGVVIISRHKADREHPVVGAASILAKVVRDRTLRDISKETGVDVGSGYPGDPITREFLADHYRRNACLPPFARASWDTCRKLTADIAQRTLFDY
ncbi:MAG: ribonuclease HII [Candidatus Thermoplasmatota archaeon]|nr:ribonuclease HII [Candidatus Thermoplasmatota archaeon]